MEETLLPDIRSIGVGPQTLDIFCGESACDTIDKLILVADRGTVGLISESADVGIVPEHDNVLSGNERPGFVYREMWRGGRGNGESVESEDGQDLGEHVEDTG